MKISGIREDILVTYALGSCIGVALFDPIAMVGGLLHFMLPTSSNDTEKARVNPCMYADTGLQHFFLVAYEFGATKKNIRTVIAGGARRSETSDYFEIGARNSVMAKRLLWKNQVLVKAEDTGGSTPRTMTIEMRTGEVFIKKGDRTSVIALQ